MHHLLTQAISLKDTLFNTDVDNGISTVDGPFSLVSLILPNAYIIAGIILLIYLVAGGFMLVSSGGNKETTQKGQQTVTQAVIGFLIIFMSYWIIQIIQVVTGVSILNPPTDIL